MIYNLSYTSRILQKYKSLIRLLSGLAAVALIVIPLFLFRDLNLESFKNIGYLGYLIANYLGYGPYLIPFLVKTLDPILLILLGAFGSTVDEFFAWFFGYTSELVENKSNLHKRIERIILKYGLFGIFVMALIPLPGFIYDIAAFVAGHYKISYPKYFVAGFSGRLIRFTIYVLGSLYVINKII